MHSKSVCVRLLPVAQNCCVGVIPPQPWKRFHSIRLQLQALPPAPIQSQRRVVVTGIGIISPLAVGTQETWRRLLLGHTATAPLPEELYGAFPSQVAARVPRGSGPHEFDMQHAVDKSNMRTQNIDYIAFALAAAREALEDAGLLQAGAPHPLPGAPGLFRCGYDLDRFGVAIGSGIGGISDTAEAASLLASPGGVAAGYRRLSPFFVPRILTNMAAGHVSIRYGLRGPNLAPSTACATGAHALGDAFRAVKHGAADAMLAGGTEACVTPLAVAGFCRARALATRFNGSPAAAARACRPFDVARDGFVLGEGAGVLLLEEAGAARARGARIYAELRGYGAAGDAHHVTAPAEDGGGAARCMAAALAEGGLGPRHVGYVNAHATGTPVGDAVEAHGLGRLFGSAKTAALRPPGAGEGAGTPGVGAVGEESLPRVRVSSTKGAIGHLLGAAGAVEAAFAVLALASQRVPHTANLDAPDPCLPDDVCEFVSASLSPAAAEAARPPLRAALSNSFGFGGTNCSLLFTRFEDE